MSWIVLEPCEEDPCCHIIPGDLDEDEKARIPGHFADGDCECNPRLEICGVTPTYIHNELPERANA